MPRMRLSGKFRVRHPCNSGLGDALAGGVSGSFARDILATLCSDMPRPEVVHPVSPETSSQLWAQRCLARGGLASFASGAAGLPGLPGGMPGSSLQACPLACGARCLAHVVPQLGLFERAMRVCYACTRHRLPQADRPHTHRKRTVGLHARVPAKPAVKSRQARSR